MQSETETTKALTPVELLDRLRIIMDRFIAAASDAQKQFETELQALVEAPECKALADAEPHLVKVIFEAEMNRMAAAVPQ